MGAEFSIVVPNYNDGRLLERCITSATSQAGVGLEVIVVDNCSTDDSESTVRTLMRRDERIRWVRNDRNMGHTYSINRGIDLAQGEYLVVLCADDLLVPGALRRVKSVMDRHPDVVLAYGRSSRDPDEVGSSAATNGERHEIVDGWTWIERCAQRGNTPILSPEAVVRTAAQRAAGPYSEDLVIANDLLSFLLVASQGKVCSFEALHGVFDSKPTSYSRSTTYLDHLRQRRDAFEAFYRHPLAAPGRALVGVHRRALGLLGVHLAQTSLVGGDPTTAREALRFSASVVSGRDDENPRLPDYVGLGRIGSQAYRVGRRKVADRVRARQAHGTRQTRWRVVHAGGSAHTG